MNIFIRADGGPDIGFGHIVRVLNLASELDMPVTFLTKYAQSRERISAKGYTVELIESEEELEEWLDNDSILITDLMTDDYGFLHGLPGKKLCIDGNTAPAHAECDILVNANVFGNETETVVGSTRHYLGPKYMILDKRFQELADKHVSTGLDELGTIFVNFGGVDKDGLTLLAMRELSHLPSSVRIDLVIGPMFPHFEELEDILAALKTDVTLHRDPDDIIAVMQSSQLAVTAAGVTLYELASLGIPSVVIPQYVWNNHQASIARAFGDAGACLNLGTEPAEGKLYESIRMLVEDKNMRNQIGAAAKKLVDGRGLARVAGLVNGLIEEV